MTRHQIQLVIRAFGDCIPDRQRLLSEQLATRHHVETMKRVAQIATRFGGARNVRSAILEAIQEAEAA